MAFEVNRRDNVSVDVDVDIVNFRIVPKTHALECASGDATKRFISLKSIYVLFSQAGACANAGALVSLHVSINEVGHGL